MKCFACQTEIEDGRARCPLCGFPVVQIVQADENELEKIRKMGNDFRRKKLEGISVGIVAYKYAMKDGELKLDKENRIEVFHCDEISPNETIWYEERFARVETEETVTLKMFVQRGDSRQLFEFDFKVPQIKGFWYIGLKMENGFKARLLLGDREVYEMSAPFSLV